MPRGDPFYRRTEADSVKKISKDAQSPPDTAEGLVRSVNASGAMVQIRGASNWTPADIVEGLSVSAGNHVLLRRSSVAARWIVYSVYSIKGIQGNTNPSKNSSSADSQVVAPSNLKIIEEGGAWLVSWTPPSTQGQLVYELEIADDTDETNSVTYRLAGSTFSVPASSHDSRYFRIRSLGSNWTRSGWTNWVQRDDTVVEYVGVLKIINRAYGVNADHQLIYMDYFEVVDGGTMDNSGEIIVMSEP